MLALDESRGTLATVQTVAAHGTVMPMALSPDRRVLYAARRNEPWSVLAFAIDARDGRLALLAEAPLPQSMAHIALDGSGRWLFSASYHGNLLALSPIDIDGRPGPATQVISTGPKAHAMRAAPGNRFVYATSLGGGVVMQFGFDAAHGTLTPMARQYGENATALSTMSARTPRAARPSARESPTGPAPAMSTLSVCAMRNFSCDLGFAAMRDRQ